MDTREKIVPGESVGALLSQGYWIAVAGLFDPLTVVQARRLSSLKRDGRKVLAIIERGENPLLAADARAALIAALRDVDAVTVADSARAIVPFDSPVELIEDADGEAARSSDFFGFVLERQRTAGK